MNNLKDLKDGVEGASRGRQHALSRNWAFFFNFLLTWPGMAGSAGSPDLPEGAAMSLGCLAEASPDLTAAATARCLTFAFWTSLFT